MTDVLKIPSRLRENSGIDISNPELRTLFPAVFNTRPSSRVSEDYQLYRTDQIIETFTDKGLKLVEIGQQHSRRRDPRTQLHMLRFQPLDAPIKDFGVGDSVPEIVIMNGHDGRNRFRALAGVFRFICSNGMVVADADLGQTVRRHYGQNNTFAKVMEILADMPAVVTAISKRIGDWEGITLDEAQQVKLARALMDVRGVPAWLEPTQVLESRRALENKALNGGRSLWTTFNVLQENLTNSDLHRNAAEGERASQLRPLSGAFANVAVNERLWATADDFMKALTGTEKAEIVADVAREKTVDLLALSTTELAARYNEAATKLGEPTVNRFSDKGAALRRTTAILERANA